MDTVPVEADVLKPEVLVKMEVEEVVGEKLVAKDKSAEVKISSVELEEPTMIGMPPQPTQDLEPQQQPPLPPPEAPAPPPPPSQLPPLPPPPSSPPTARSVDLLSTILSSMDK